MPRVSVCIVHYNSGSYVARALAHLEAQRFRDFDVIIVDNGASDNPLPSPLSFSFPIQVIGDGSNIGFAAGNNLAAKAAEGKWLALLNPDAYPEPDWLLQLISATEHAPSCVMFGSTQICAENPSLLDGAGDFYHIFGIPGRGGYHRPISELPDSGEVFAPCAAAALIRRDVFLELGGFDERLFCYCEEADFALRARMRGYYALQIKEARVLHEGSAITRSKSGFAAYYGMRNRLWIYVKNMPLPLLIATLPFHIVMQAVFLTRSILTKTFPSSFRGLKDGLLGLPNLWKERPAIEATRTVPLPVFTRFFTFSLFKLFLRLPDVR